MVEINVANTGINELIISNYTNLLSASIWSFGNSYSPIYKANVSSAKGRKGITKRLESFNKMGN